MQKKEEDTFRDLLIIDSLRGEHSTGTAFVAWDSEISLAKTVGDPFQLLETIAFNSGMRQNNKCIIGHNRFATVGKVVRKNAHPFLTGNVVGAHNGTLENKYQLEDAFKFDTDSEALFHTIDIKGAKDTLEMVKGAYALSWYNKREDSISLMRNKERPLYCTWAKGRKVIFWASEAWMLNTILARNSIEHEDVWIIPENQKYTFTIPKTHEAFGNPVVEAIAQKQTSFSNGGCMGRPVSTIRTIENKPHINNVIKISQGALKGKQVYLKPRWVGGHASTFFVQFICLEHPNVNFRVFRKTLEECQDILAKGECIAVVGGFKHGKDKYYKVSSESITYPLEKKNHLGETISLVEFYTDYSTCNFCGSNLSYEDDFKILGRKECLCAECAKDDEILKYLPRSC